MLAFVASIILAIAPPPVLRPGKLVGQVHQVTLPRGMSIPYLAARYGVHPVRILKPSRQQLQDGLQAGERLMVDQRRIEPVFDPKWSGIVLNVPEAHVYLLERGKLLADYPVGVSRGDWQAPIGEFRVVSMQKNPTWHVPLSIQKEMEASGRPVIKSIPPGPFNPLGSRWIGFGNGRLGFHGTTSPTSIKHYASHGCVRMLAPHIEDLYQRVRVGTPVRVVYQPVLMAVSGDQIWLSVYPDVYGRQVDLMAQVRQLAEVAGVGGQLDWSLIAQKAKERDGMVSDVARPTTIPPGLRPRVTGSAENS